MPKEGGRKASRGGKRRTLSKHRFLLSAVVGLEAPAAVLTVLCLLAAVVAALLPFERGGDAFVAKFVVAGGCVLLALCGGFYLWWRFRRCPSSVHLYDSGLTWRRWGSEYEYDWGDVAEVYRSEVVRIGPHGRSRRVDLEVSFKDGESMYLNNALNRYDDLANTLQTEAARGLLVEFGDAQTNDRADFGRIHLTEEGVGIDDDFIPLAKLKRPLVSNGHLIFRDARYEYELPLSEIPNYLILFELLAKWDRYPVGRSPFRL